MGKTKNPWIDSLVVDYLKRTRRMTACEILEMPDLSRKRGLRGEQLKIAESAEIEKTIGEKCRKVFLDDKGTQFSSVEFARWIQKEQLGGTRRLVFVMGGPDGLTKDLLTRADLRLSLGNMTWTHELVRLLIVEQIYRAFCILGNSPYHR